MNSNDNNKNKDEVTWIDVLGYLIATMFFMLIITGLCWLAGPVVQTC